MNCFRTPRLIPEKAVFRPALALRSLPGSNGTNMEKLTYPEQLKHPLWQRKRLEAMDAHGFVCRKCGSTDKTLHVHHKQYIKGRMAWEYEVDELSVLCEDCHSDEHDQQDLLKRLIDNARGCSTPPLAMAIGLLAGYYQGHHSGEIDEDLAMRASDLAPNAFVSGLFLGGMAGRVRVYEGARFVREAYQSLGVAMAPSVAKLVEDWESLRPAAKPVEGEGVD